MDKVKIAAELNEMRIPDLQKRFAEVTGEATRSPNRKFLVKRILAEMESAVALQKAGPAEKTDALPTTGATAENDAEAAAPKSIAEMKSIEVETLPDEATEEPTPAAPAKSRRGRKPKKATTPPGDADIRVQIGPDGGVCSLAEFLAENEFDDETKAAIRETLRAGRTHHGGGGAAPEWSVSPMETADGEDDAAGAKLSKMSLDDLRARYHETIGRPTGSTNKRYLVWKIGEALKGKVRIGPRATGPRGEGTASKVIPMRIPAAALEPLDEARRRMGLRSRNELLANAVAAYLARNGEAEVARQFAGEEVAVAEAE